VETDFAAFTGLETPVAPEFGVNGPTIFRGIEQDHFMRLSGGDLEAHPDLQQAVPNDPTMSVGPDGMCLLVLNLEVSSTAE
jgi:hypothetical protein